MGRHYKWLLLALLSFAYFFNQADRVLFGLLTIPIQDELHLTDLQIGFVNTALFVTLAFTVPLAGILGDRFNRKWVITGALLFWSFKTGCRAFFCCPTVVLNAIGFIAICFANNAYISWAPKFAAQKFGLTVGAAGNGTMLYHHLAAFVAILIAGWVTDAMIRRGNPRFRLLLQFTAMFLGAPMLVWFGFAPTVAACFAATTLYGVFRGLYEANTQASAFDVVRPENRAMVVALADLLAMFIGSLSPLLIGAMSDRMGLRGFEWGFAIMGGAYAVGALAMGCAALFTFRKDRIDE